MPSTQEKKDEAEMKGARIKRTLELLVSAATKFRHEIRNATDFPVGETIPAILDSAEHADAFGCFFDPTGWIATKKNRDFNAAFLRVIQKFDAGVAGLMQEEHGCKEKMHPLLGGGTCPICGERIPDKEELCPESTT